MPGNSYLKFLENAFGSSFSQDPFLYSSDALVKYFSPPDGLDLARTGNLVLLLGKHDPAISLMIHKPDAIFSHPEHAYMLVILDTSHIRAQFSEWVKKGHMSLLHRDIVLFSVVDAIEKAVAKLLAPLPLVLLNRSSLLEMSLHDFFVKLTEAITRLPRKGSETYKGIMLIANATRLSGNVDELLDDFEDIARLEIKRLSVKLLLEREHRETVRDRNIEFQEVVWREKHIKQMLAMCVLACTSEPAPDKNHMEDQLREYSLSRAFQSCLDREARDKVEDIVVAMAEGELYKAVRLARKIAQECASIQEEGSTLDLGNLLALTGIPKDIYARSIARVLDDNDHACGIGFLVSHKGEKLFITCRHIIRDSKKIKVQFFGQDTRIECQEKQSSARTTESDSHPSALSTWEEVCVLEPDSETDIERIPIPLDEVKAISEANAGDVCSLFTFISHIAPGPDWIEGLTVDEIPDVGFGHLKGLPAISLEGTSGTPIYSTRGRVVGMFQSQWYGTDIGYFIPLKTIHQVVERIST